MRTGATIGCVLLVLCMSALVPSLSLAEAIKLHRFHIRDDAGARTCSWDPATSQLAVTLVPSVNYRLDESAHFSLDADPVDGTLASCSELESVAYADVRSASVSVGSGLSVIWIRPPAYGTAYAGPSIEVTSRPGSEQQRVTMVLSLDAAAGGRTTNVTAKSNGLDLDSNGTVDVTMQLAQWDVEVLGEGGWGRFDLRAAPVRPFVLAEVDSLKPLRFVFGDGSTQLLGPTVDRGVDVQTGASDDVVRISGGTVRTFAGDDVITARTGGTIMAGDGRDDVRTGGSSSMVYGDGDQSTPSTLLDGAADRIRTGAGRDLVHSGRGRDVVRTGGGKDEIIELFDAIDLDAGSGPDVIRVRGVHRNRRLRCGRGADRVWYWPRRGFSSSSCEQIKVTLRSLVDSSFGGWLAPAHAERDYNPRHYDGDDSPFDDVAAADGVHRCAWDAETQTLRMRVGGAGDSYARVARNGCRGHAPKRVVVSVASQRSMLVVKPSLDARSADEVKYDFHPAHGRAHSSPTIVIDDDGARTSDPPYRIVATDTGLDLNGDGDVDVRIHDAPTWNVEVDTPRHPGSFDLRAVPAKRHERAWYHLAHQGNTVLGPRSGPDVVLVANGARWGSPLISAKRDVVRLGPGDDSVYTYGGSDEISTGAGRDYIDSGVGSDVIRSGRGDDQVVADNHSDKRWARGNDRVWLGPGNDTATVGGGSDRTFGGPGRDQIIDVGVGGGLVDAGSGSDQVEAWGARGTRVVIRCGSGADLIRRPPEPGARYVHRSCERSTDNLTYVSSWARALWGRHLFERRWQ